MNSGDLNSGPHAHTADLTNHFFPSSNSLSLSVPPFNLGHGEESQAQLPFSPFQTHHFYI